MVLNHSTAGPSPAGVHQNVVEGRRHLAQHLAQEGLIVRSQVGHLGDPGTGRQHPQARADGHHRLQGIDVPVQDIPHIDLHFQPQKNVDVGQPQVAVHQEHPPSLVGQGKGQIDGQAGFAHTTLTAGNTPEFRLSHMTHLPCRYDEFCR